MTESDREDGIANGSAEAPEAADRTSGRRSQGWLESMLVAVLLALGIRHFLVQAYKIPSGSMIPTLLIGDQLIASKLTYGVRLPFMSDKLVKFARPQHGDIVVFRFPEDPTKDFIKRVIAAPGDRVRIEDGTIFVSDVAIARKEIGPFRYDTADGGATGARLFEELHGGTTYNVLYADGAFHAYWNMPEIQLSDDQIFVMGDNRDHSNDSRFWGPVDLDLVEGAPLVIHFSWDDLTTGVRWSRMGTLLH